MGDCASVYANRMIVLKKGFKEADSEGKGKVSLNQLRNVFQLHSELGEAWQNVLAKNDGAKEVTYDELLNMLEDVQFEDLVFAQRVRRNYKYFIETMVKNADTNQTGTISATELKEVKRRRPSIEQASVRPSLKLRLQPENG